MRADLDRMVLVMYRTDREQAAARLPDGLQVRLLRGHAMAGILIAQGNRPRRGWVGHGSGTVGEAYHFLNVSRPAASRKRPSVLVTRHDTSSRLQTWVGAGRSRAQLAVFRQHDRPGVIDWTVEAADGQLRVAIRAQLVRHLPAGSVFASCHHASSWLQEVVRELGIVAPPPPYRFCWNPKPRRWRLEPLQVERVQSTDFDDARRLPPGAAEFDSAFWLHRVECVWDEQDRVCCDMATA